MTYTLLKADFQFNSNSKQIESKSLEILSANMPYFQEHALWRP